MPGSPTIPTRRPCPHMARSRCWASRCELGGAPDEAGHAPAGSKPRALEARRRDTRGRPGQGRRGHRNQREAAAQERGRLLGDGDGARRRREPLERVERGLLARDVDEGHLAHLPRGDGRHVDGAAHRGGAVIGAALLGHPLRGEARQRGADRAILDRLLDAECRDDRRLPQLLDATAEAADLVEQLVDRPRALGRGRPSPGPPPGRRGGSRPRETPSARSSARGSRAGSGRRRPGPCRESARPRARRYLRAGPPARRGTPTRIPASPTRALGRARSAPCAHAPYCARCPAPPRYARCSSWSGRARRGGARPSACARTADRATPGPAGGPPRSSTRAGRARRRSRSAHRSAGPPARGHCPAPGHCRARSSRPARPARPGRTSARRARSPRRPVRGGARR